MNITKLNMPLTVVMLLELKYHFLAILKCQFQGKRLGRYSNLY